MVKQFDLGVCTVAAVGDDGDPVWHNGLDIKKVQLRSARNEFKGSIIYMCSGCREAYKNQFVLLED